MWFIPVPGQVMGFKAGWRRVQPGNFQPGSGQHRIEDFAQGRSEHVVRV